MKKLFKAGHKIFYTKIYSVTDVSKDGSWLMECFFIKDVRHVLRFKKIA